MAKDNFYFFLSGFISLSLFGIILSLFMYMMFFTSQTKSFAMKKDNYISISMNVVEIPKKKLEKKIKNPVVKQEEPEILEVEPQVDISDLFSNVKAKKIKKKPNKKTHRVQELSNKPKSATASKRTQKENEEKESSSGNEVNEYLAKIQALVYKYFYPPDNSQGHSVKAVIVLSAIGKVLDFRILNYSSNKALNDECDKIQSRLKSVLFPINPNNKSGNYTVILTSKE